MPASNSYHNQTTASHNEAYANYEDTVLLSDDYTGTGSDNVTFGMRRPFQGLSLDIKTTAAQGAVVWKYWSNHGWAGFSPIRDDTNNLRNPGVGTILWEIPEEDWEPRQWSPLVSTATMKNYCTDPHQYYWVMAAESTIYNVQPVAAQVSGILTNVRVKVTTELGDIVTGMQASHFEASEGTVNEVIHAVEVQDGVYDLALDTGGADHDFKIAAAPPGFVRSDPIATGATSNRTLTNLSASPLVLKYPIKVTVESDGALPVVDADVTWSGLEPDVVRNGNVHYFQTDSVDPGEITVTADGFASFSDTTNTEARNVFAGSLQQTHVKLSGKEPCSEGSETPAGATVVCHGLVSTGGSSGTSSSAPTSSRPISFTFPTVPRTSGVGIKTSASPTLPPGSECAAAEVAPAGLYTKAVSRVASDELMRLCMDYVSAVGVERVDVALGLEAQRVELRVEPAPAFKSEWSHDGIEDPPGEHHFGFVTVGVHVDGIPWTGPVQATTFRFHVTRAQLSEVGLHADDVQVYRWDGDAWEAVPTSVEGQSESDYAFSASAPGQGVFAVSGVNAAEAPTMPIWPWLIGGFIALGLIGFGIATIVRRRHHAHDGLPPKDHAPNPKEGAPAPAAPVTPPAAPKVPVIR